MIRWGKGLGRVISWLGVNLLRLAAIMSLAYYVVFLVDCVAEASLAWWGVPLAALYLTIWVVPILFVIAFPSAVTYLLLLQVVSLMHLDRRLERTIAIGLAALVAVAFHSELLSADAWGATAIATALVFGAVVRLGQPA